MKKNKNPNSISIRKYIYSGSISGFITTLVFTVIHHIFISDIWYTFIFMAIAGIICGSLIALSYGMIFHEFTLLKWINYNSIYLLMFLLLGLVSVIVFEPVTTVAILMKENKRPDELINSALPLTVSFTIVFSIILSVLYGKKMMDYIMIFLTCSILMIFLGLNVSILGLVSIPTDSLYLILELFSLIIVILLTYSVAFAVLQNRRGQ